MKNGFKSTERGSVFECTRCGKRTRAVSEEQLDGEVCLACLCASYTENEHLNPVPGGPVHTGEFNLKTCPACAADYKARLAYYKHSREGEKN